MPTRLISQVTPFNSNDNNDYGLRASAVQYGTSSTGAGTAAKAVTCATFTADYLVEGAIVAVKFNNTNTATASGLTLNVNSTGAKPIKYIYNGNLNNLPDAGYLKAGQIYLFYYDGTNWVTLLNYDTNEITSVSSDNNTARYGQSVTVGTVKGTALKFTMPTNYTNELVLPKQLNGLNDPTLTAKINSTRANRLAFLPADQIIIEKTTDGGATWVDAQISDSTKLALFSETRPGVNIPLINGVRNINCGLRITFSAMKYNVPDGTAETQKYNYWNSSYVKSQERYCQLKEMYFWVSSASDGISLKVERATGANSTSWSTIYDSGSTYALTGWSGCDYISFSQSTFGGGTTQTGNHWNYRLTFFTRNNTGGTTLATSSTTSAQSIMEIRGYGDTWWSGPNNYMKNDHLYSFNANQEATFPAKVTAPTFAGNLDWSYIQNKPTLLTASIPNSVTSLNWNTDTTIATIGGDQLKIKIPANPNTDEKVNQAYASDNKNYRILLSNSDSTGAETAGTKKDTNFTYNPSTNNLQVEKINGIEVGSSPKFTDTTYTFENKNATLAWGESVNIAKVGGTTITATLPANPNVWNANALNVAGYVAAPTSTTSNKVWKTDASGTPAWRDDEDTKVTVEPFSNALQWGTSVTIAKVNGTQINATLPNNPNTNTDTLVKQTSISTNANYPILLKKSNNANAETAEANATNLTNGTTVTINPSTGNLNVVKINGVDVGSSPKFTDTTYSFVNKNATLTWGSATEIADVGGTKIMVSLPANPNTDTHHTAKLVTSSSNQGTTTVAGGTNSIYLNLIENSTVRSSHNIVGAGTVTVSSDASGKITIKGEGVNTDIYTRQQLYTSNYNLPLLMSYQTNTNTTQNIDNITFRNNDMYGNPSTGQINAKQFQVDKAVTLQYNSTTKSLDFIFA